MGNQSGRNAGAHRKHVQQSWNTIYAHDPELLNKALSDAWLRAAEQTPTWIWALVDLPETMQTNYQENSQFVGIIQQVRDFLHVLIKVHKCEPEMVQTLSFRLGARHRHYMSDGRDNAYWHPFVQLVPPAITKTYFNVINQNGRLRRLLRIRPGGEKSEEEALLDAWRVFMAAVVEAMKRGYEGFANEKTPLRLSLTNSIISMASFRSSRSRSASHFLEPVISISPSTCRASSAIETERRDHNIPDYPPSPLLFPGRRSRSIFRSRPTRSSQELGPYRRLSSPNNPSRLSTNDVPDDMNGGATQRRSFTLSPGGPIPR